VPEAAVDENGNACPREYQVRLPARIGIRPHVEAKPQPSAMQARPQDYLRCCIT
jgi:hypothetical protein